MLVNEEGRPRLLLHKVLLLLRCLSPLIALSSKMARSVEAEDSRFITKDT